MDLVADRTLLDAYRRGDPAVLERIYRAHAPGLARVLRHGFTFESGGRTCRFHGVRSEFDLEDRVQEVFTRVFAERVRLNYDGLTPFAAYIRTVARNLVIDDFRRKERFLVEYSVEPPEPPPEPASEAGSEPLLGRFESTGRPEEDQDRAELGALVQAFKLSLAARERRVYELRFECELEHDVIAGKTGLSVSKIKTSEQRIRTRFFKFMRKHGYFTGYVQESRGWLRFSRSS